MNSMFVTESEVEEEKKRKQENWEKNRRPDQPLLAPEEPEDHRSLYERLKEQKDKKDSEWEEAHKFKNQIRGLESEEVEFFNAVDEQKEEIERQKKKEDDELIKEFRNTNARVVKVPSLVDKLGLSIKPLVAGKRKRSDGGDEGKVDSKKPKSSKTSSSQQTSSSLANKNDSQTTTTSTTTNSSTTSIANTTTNSVATTTSTTNFESNHNNTITETTNTFDSTNQNIQVAGVLPSLVAYAPSDAEDSQSDTDTSASSEDEISFEAASLFRRPVKTCKK